MLVTQKPSEPIRRAVGRFAKTGTRVPSGLKTGAILTISSRKYTLPVVWKSGDVTFRKPRFVGWQHLGFSGSAPVRITTKHHGGRTRVACVSVGPFSEAAQAALASMQSNQRLRRRRFTVASLSVSSLMVQALWLKSKGGDRFWILEPSHVAAVRGRVITARQFEASLRRVFGTLSGDVSTVNERLSETRL
jgi:hypothetical protein